MAETSHSLNPNAAPFVTGGGPCQQPAKMTPSPPLLLPHERYSQTSPKLLLQPPPPPISSSNVASVLHFSTAATAFCHDQHYYFCYGDHFFYHRRQTLYYATVGAGNCHGGFHPIPHHALPLSPAETAAADSYSFQLVPTASYAVKNFSASELERRTVVKKKKILKKKKYVPHRRGGGSKDTGQCKRSSALTKVSPSFTEEKKNNGGDGPTSLMIRNIPNHLQRVQMLGYLDSHCAAENSTAGAGGVLSEYDFFYLPIDFMTGANLGYAFVSFTTAVAASRFLQDFDGYAWRVRDSGKICQITAATIQGKEALVANFSNSRFECHRDQYLPVVFDPPRGGRFPKSVGEVVGQRVAPLRRTANSVRHNSPKFN